MSERRGRGRKKTQKNSSRATREQGFEILARQSSNNIVYKGSGRGGLSPPPSSVVGNALVVIDDGIESVSVKNRYQGARVSARRANP